MSGLAHVTWLTEHVEGRGGAESYVLDVARRLRERGVRSSVLFDARTRVGTATRETFDGAFPVVELERQLDTLGPDVIYAQRLPRGVSLERALGSRAPVARFVHDHALFCLREHKYTALQKRTCDDPIGLRCYPCLGMVRQEREPQRLRLVGLGALRRELTLHRSCAAIVVGSRHMKRQAIAHGLDPARVALLPLYAKEQERTATLREPGLVVYAGALTTGKGLDVLLEALRHTRHVKRLVLLGDGPQRESLQASTHRHSRQSTVEFLGPLEHSQVLDWMRRATCLVLPTRQPESFGLVGVEAMSVATPVVATAIGGALDWLHDGVTGLAVPSCDPRALADALDQLAASPERASRLGEAGRELQRQCFTPERHIDGLVSLLSTVAAGGSP